MSNWRTQLAKEPKKKTDAELAQAVYNAAAALRLAVQEAEDESLEIEIRFEQDFMKSITGYSEYPRPHDYMTIRRYYYSEDE